MSKTRRKKNSSVADITINDFANSERRQGCGRVKKNALVHPISIADLPEVHGENEYEDLSWHGNFKSVTTLRERRASNSPSPCNTQDSGAEYPMDVWFILSNYIRPEDVGRFAGICQASYAVVRTAYFWILMYKRWFREDVEVPQHLNSDCLTRRYKLRGRVIQYLYHVYKPFTKFKYTDYINSLNLLRSGESGLTGRLCVAAWSKKTEPSGSQYIFNIKLKDVDENLCRTAPKRAKPDLLTTLDDVYANDDEGCKLLQFLANCYGPIEMVYNQRLRYFNLKTDPTTTFHTIEMHFGVGPGKYQVGQTIIIHSIIIARVLNWWEPSYIPYAPPSGRDFQPFDAFDVETFLSLFPEDN